MRFVLAALALLFLPAAARAEAVTSCGRVEADGTRTLCHEITLTASPADLWTLWSTTAGLSSWVAPVAAIDLRVGGIWEVSYDPAARVGDAGNIRNRILSYLPGRMLSIAVDRAPPGFAHADLVGRLWTVIELEQVNADRTRVRVTMLGYGHGEGYDALHRDFERGNAYTLTLLERRIASGPTPWAARTVPINRAGDARKK